MIEQRYIELALLEPNEGQLAGIPRNPRKISRTKLASLKRSLVDNPEMQELRELWVVPHGGKFVVVDGNMRLKALRSLREKTAICKVIPETFTPEQIKAAIVKSGISFGDWDADLLTDDEGWDFGDLEDWGMDLGFTKERKTREGKGEDEPQEDEYKFDVKDVLFASDNDFEIPTLREDMQAGKLELPIMPWGAASRLTAKVTTYHFYVDDYRFEALWKDPLKLVNCGCKSIVEPNFSLHDQTPIAYGLHNIYRKRWIARYMQDCGVSVYVDLNVAQKFAEYNCLGVPNGWDAFFTRGITGEADRVANDLEVARRISGKQTPNLIVYGGGADVKELCKKENLLYVQDYIHQKTI